jgi:hypothetical protein
MTGHRSFKELTKGFSAEHKARVETRVSQLKTDMALHELRQACERSQEHLARALRVGQPAPPPSLNGAQICMSAICDAM